MHVPDGFLSPQTYVPAFALAAGAWAYAARALRQRLDDTLLPRLAVLSALGFVLMSVMLPLPGGTSVHASGIGILAVVLGPWITFAAVSLVLLLPLAERSPALFSVKSKGPLLPSAWSACSRVKPWRTSS